MVPDPGTLYRAYTARDPRFDGVFYIGVTSTGVYCRPICPARTPKAGNCRFFESAEAAEKASFRPCLRCRPELAPGTAPVDNSRSIARLIAQRIDEGLLDDGARLEKIATEFGWSSRQIRRMVQRELGVSPMELVLTRRLLLAKQLLTETRLPIIQVAFASGFSSVRRFNDAFSGRYGIPPTHFRRSADEPGSGTAAGGSFTLQLAYRPPFDWDGLIQFLGARALAGVETAAAGVYSRTVRLGSHTGWVRVGHEPRRRALMVEMPIALTPVLPALLGRLRQLFDLAARPDVIQEHLRRDPVLSRAVRRNPGLRVPGAFDGFELVMRAIVGQQVTVKAATTLAGRIVGSFGERVTTPHGGLTHLAPTPERIATASQDALGALGIIGTRGRSLIAVAREMVAGRLPLEAGADPESTMERLTAIPGIGRWTAHYIAMRALRWPDAFPREDIALRKRLGGVTPSEAEAASQAWRPWRSYATLHLWQA